MTPDSACPRSDKGADGPCSDTPGLTTKNLSSVNNLACLCSHNGPFWPIECTNIENILDNTCSVKEPWVAADEHDGDCASSGEAPGLLLASKLPSGEDDGS